MTIEEFRAKKQNILNSRPVKNSNNEMSIDEFRKKKQQILTGVTEQSKTQETVDEQVSSPQTIQQKMDELWEEEKQTTNRTSVNNKSFEKTAPSTSTMINDVMKKTAGNVLNTILPGSKPVLSATNAIVKQSTGEDIKPLKAVNTVTGALANLGTGVLKGSEALVDSGVSLVTDIKSRMADSQSKRLQDTYDQAFNEYVKDKNLSEEEKQQMYKQYKTAVDQEKLRIEQERNYDKAFGEEFVKKDLIGDKMNKPIQEFTEKQTYLPQQLANTIQTVGNMLPSVYLGGKAMGALGVTGQAANKTGKAIQTVTNMTPFVAQATGSAMEQALNEGAEFDKAYDYARMAGAMEGAIESLSGGIGGLAGNKILSSQLSKEVANKISKNLIGKYALKLADAGIDVAGEGFEEVLATFADPFLKQLTYDEQAELATNEEMMQSFWDGVLASMLLKGGQVGANKINQSINTNSETQKLNKIDSTTQSQLEQINNNLLEDEKIDTKNKTTEEIKSELEKLIPMQKNGVSQAPQNELNNIGNQIIPNEMQIAQNGNMEQIQPSLENDVKFEETKRFASDYEQKIGRKVNVFTSNDPDIHGYTENGEIYLNSNSNKAKTVTYIHELTHNLEREKAYSKFANEVIESNMFKEFLNNKNTTLQEYQEQIKTAYKEKLNKDLDETGVMHEVIANFAGESKLFDSQESINRLAVENNNIFTKIKDFIDDLVVKFTGTAEQKELRRIQNMYRKALEQARSTENTTSDTKYHISSNLSNDIDNVLVNLNERNPVKLRDYTPNILVQNGIKDLPMYENPSHMRKNILSENEARNIGLQVARNDHYHGLGKELYIKVIDSLDDPRAVLKYKNKSNEYIILTVVKDSQGNNIIVPVEVETDTYVNNVKIDINRIKSVYGYDRTNPDLNKYIKDSIKNNNLEKIYEKKKPSTGKTPQSVSNNSINQNDSSVNTQYSLDKQNDTAGKEPVFSMPKIDNSDIRYTVTPTSKSQQYQRRKENAFIKDVSNALGISEFANKQALRKTVSEVAEEIKNGNFQSRDELFEKIFNEGIAVNDEFYNQYKELKNTIKNTKLNINDEIKKGIVDYEQFRKNNFGKLTITGDNSGINIDTYYQELNEQYPELFPTTINTPSDQLVRISEVSKSIEKVKTEISKYAGNDKEYKNWAKNEFDKNFNKLIEEMKIVSRVENDKRIAKEDTKINMSMADNAKIDDLKELYSVIKTLKKDYEKISNKQLLTKKDKTTLDRLLKGEITLKELPKYSNVEGIKELYAAKKPIMDMENVIKQYNAARKEKLRNEAKNVLENSNNWKEKLTGIQYAREIMERNFVDVAGKKDGEKLNKIYAEPVHIHEADATRLKNKYREQVKALNLSDKELYDISYIGEFQQGRNPNIEEKPVFKKVSERGLVQLYGEGKINDNTLKELGVEVEKIKNAVSTFREIYNDLLEMSNDALVANGYAPVDYRKDYFPHFIDNKSDSLLSKLGSVIGIETNTKELPTDIAGLTHTFRPGKKWVGNFLQRTSEVTDFDAVKGFDRYIEGVADVIFHTEDIQRLRALEDEIRYKYSDKGVQEQIDQIKEDDDIAPEDKRNRIEEIYKTNKHEFPHLVSWLRSYTDSLAGKKSIEDRIAEQQLGRIVYDISKSVENRVAANMIGLNINSWLTNFIPLAQASGTTKGKYLLNAMKDTIRGYAKTDGLRDRSTFLTNREGSDPLVKTFNQKLSSALDGMRIIDNFTSETLVRARYYQNMANGMTQEEALQEADRNTAKIMGDRSKGAMPTLFNVKNPVSKLMTMFQLEQNNQFSYYFKDVPDELKEKGAKAIALALAKIFIASWLYNEAKEEFTGSRSAFDPIDILVNLGKNVKNKGIKGTGDTVLELIEATPFIGGLLGGGRIPISSALPDITGLLKGETTIKKELVKPLTYLVAPMGGGQIKKTIEGIDTFAKGGNYGTDSQGRKTLKYPVKQDVGNAVKSALFGKYSTEYAQDYIDNDFKSLSAKQTEGYEKAKKQDITYDVFLKAYNAQKNVEGDKDSNGKTISLSASKNKKKAIDELLPGYTQKQKQTLYEAFGISEKVW